MNLHFNTLFPLFLSRLSLGFAAILLLISPAHSAEFQLPEYKIVKLDNGITLYLMEQHEVPMIDINVVITSGAIADGKESGLAEATASSLLLGTETMTKTQIEEAVEFVGANLSSSASLEYSKVSASFLVKDTQTILPILSDVIQKPQFAPEEFQKYQARHLDQLKIRKESPEDVVGDYFKQLVFPNHVYSNVVDGTSDAFGKLTVEAVKGFYQRHYTPDSMAITVVGDFATNDMAKELKALFGSWKNTPLRGPKQANVAKIRAPKKARVLLVNKDDARQSTFLIGGKGISRSDPDFVALRVINTILGGRFSSWLNTELRVNSGLSYGARSRFSARKMGGAFYISSYTDTANTQKALDLALSTYDRLWQNEISTTLLSSAKAYVKGQFPPNYETSSQLANLLSQMHIYGFNEGFINTFQSNVDSLTLEKTTQLIEKHFPHEQLQMVVIGKADEIRDVLKKYGEITEIEITEPGFSIQ